jgi:hypothetical protein
MFCRRGYVCTTRGTYSFLGLRRVVSFKKTDVSEVHTASIIALMMEAVHTCETSIYFNGTTQRCIREGCNLYTRNVRTLNLTK